MKNNLNLRQDFNPYNLFKLFDNNLKGFVTINDL